MIRATWSKAVQLKVFRAVVVACLDCGHEDAVNSEDKEWRCPKCDKLWTMEQLRRRKPQ